MRQKIQTTIDDGSTTIVLLNNSYDQSLYWDMMTDAWQPLDEELKQLGFYDADLYQQTVLKAGMIDGRQVLVPLLYDVPGMIRAVEKPQGEPVSFEKFLSLLEQQMREELGEYQKMEVLSNGILEGKEPDLFLGAAGQPWDQYENQEKLFQILLEYCQLYQETQQAGGSSLQQQWAAYALTIQGKRDSSISEKTLKDLQVDTEVPLFGNFHFAIQTQTAYLVSCGGPEKIPFHSVAGLLTYGSCNQEVNLGVSERGRGWIQKELAYWPIGSMNEAESYAAQPISYAAVLTGSNAELAARVIQALTELSVGIQFGFSVQLEVCENQLEKWEADALDVNRVRSIGNRLETGNYVESYQASDAMISDQSKPETRKAFMNTMRRQLEHIVSAQIPDSGGAAIWQKTLKESVREGLSAEAGFERLCERMREYETASIE